MAKAIIVLIGNPLSTNQVYRSANRGGRCIRYLTTKARDRKEYYTERARFQYDGEPLKCDLLVEVSLFFGDKRRRDP